MELECGCVDECCSLCRVALAVQRLRLRSCGCAANEPPNLNKLRGAKHKEAREADDGVPVMWYWQMTGTRWDLDSHSFDIAKKAFNRLASGTQAPDQLTAVTPAFCRDPATSVVAACAVPFSHPWAEMLPVLIRSPEADTPSNWAEPRLEQMGLEALQAALFMYLCGSKSQNVLNSRGRARRHSVLFIHNWELFFKSGC